MTKKIKFTRVPRHRPLILLKHFFIKSSAEPRTQKCFPLVAHPLLILVLLPGLIAAGVSASNRFCATDSLGRRHTISLTPSPLFSFGARNDKPVPFLGEIRTIFLYKRYIHVCISAECAITIRYIAPSRI